ncbi:hypothetical protein [Flavihumibacter petaseus]|uniref:Quinol oxidase subunit 4 n=1 Tax=Flavihumibacter petaseus NBRC 106054 TaxID=1220578 RepID=A0A0E9N0N6_9BACT|nr:hypothetical protein [Flavihumibacter petaseus]GAO43206.1 hypothetical protein FPE01S_02_03100 [Flavihumibacter petaseus NBRC 106054]
MKNLRVSLLVISFVIGIAGTSCVHVHHTDHVHHKKGLPPGQAKKVNGDKSAKAYAPGQQKKKH